AKLHLLLAQRLKAFCDPCEQELATELALHFEGGHDYDEAIRYLIFASENAAGRFAYRDSIEILHHALELVPKVASGNRIELEIQILGRIGDTHYVMGNMADSAQAHEKAASHAGESALGAAQVNAWICLTLPLGMIDVDQAIASVEQAAHIGAFLEDPLLAARSQMLAACARLFSTNWRDDE